MEKPSFRHSLRGAAAGCAVILGLLCALVLSVSCGSAVPTAVVPADPRFVAAHSAGTVSRHGEILVVLARDYGGREGESPVRNPFRLEPAVEGTAVWKDGSTLAFRPSAPLAAGKGYAVSVDLSALDPGVREPFSFRIRTPEPAMTVELGSLRASRDGTLELPGRIVLSDAEGADKVERVLSARFRGLRPGIVWTHQGTLHDFTVRGFSSAGRDDDLEVSWDGRSVGAAVRGGRSVRVPASGAFEVTGVRAVREGETCLEISLSSPVDPSQDFRGRIEVEGLGNLRFAPAGGLVRVYASSAWPEEARVRIGEGLRDSEGRSLAVPVQATVPVSWEKPAVRFAASGVVLPTGEGLSLPVETRNLAGVVVEVLRIPGDNILQFLQVNNLDGEEELHRTGEVVWRKAFDLPWSDARRNQWTASGLDLSPLLAKYKDGMYRIRLSFLRDQVRYVCRTEHDFSDLVFPTLENLDRIWDGDWEARYKFRDDPCHPVFYEQNSVYRNVLVSDLALGAKRDADDRTVVFAVDLRTARPIPDLEVILYNFQRRELARGRTDKEGVVSFPGSRDAYTAAAFRSGQAAYLKLDPGSVLATSHFDAGGIAAETGVKGFLYGERGVWRPGDEMHLTFLLLDRLKTLPAGHPVRFELENPMGKVVQTSVLTEGTDGFYPFKARTGEDAPTGTYLARVTVGDRVFTRNVKVETIVPNRLKIDFEHGGGAYLGGGESRFTLKSQWLHGAPAPGLKADVSVAFSPAPTTFPGFGDYVFEDPTRRMATERQTIFDGRLDAEGSASFTSTFDAAGAAPGMATAQFAVRVFEPGGFFSSEQFSVPFHPYPRYVGLKLETRWDTIKADQDQRVQLALVDRDGKPAPAQNLEVSVHRIRENWWWEGGEDSLPEYARSIFERSVLKGQAAVRDGRGSWTFKISQADSWGIYLIRVRDPVSGHSASRVFWVSRYDWYGKPGEKAAPSNLTLTASRERYTPGQTVRVSFPSNSRGRALVTVERSGRILSRKWMDCAEGTTTVEFEATAGMSPNVYLHVDFVQPHAGRGNDLPIRLYGILPILVDDPATALAPRIEAPESFEPNKPAVFRVRETSWKPMTVTVAVVDEGLLGITRYKTPNPRDQFYRKEASALRAWDIFDFVAGAYSGKLETLLAVGGGDGGELEGGRKPSRFPPVVRYFGPVTLAAGQTKSFSTDLGPYVGAVRIMAVAGRSDGAYGAAEATVPVKSPLMVQATVPRVLSLEEWTAVPAAVFSSLGPGASVTVRISASGAAEVEGEAVRTISFDRDGERNAEFRVRARSVPGTARIVVTAEGGGKRSEHAVDLPIRPAGAKAAADWEAQASPGVTAELDLPFPGMPGTNKVWLELSPLEPIQLTRRVNYLIGYPHGCAEQTVSKAFPQIFLPEAANLSEWELEDARTNVRAAIAKLPDFQTPSWGLALWPGSGREDDWVSVYAAHFLLSARAAGYEVPPGLFEPLWKHLDARAVAWGSQHSWAKATQAYRLYVLARAGKPNAAAMNRLRDAGKLPSQALWQLAAAYALSGRRDIAGDLVKGLDPRIEAARSLDEDYYYYSYGSDFRDASIVLDALNALGDEARAAGLYRDIA
ncbi:MAG: alpha-2-macroglobulin, partial [Treponema sp.]|nr:alpha-2-macroglobulin [Treponema sp.]